MLTTVKHHLSIENYTSIFYLFDCISYFFASKIHDQPILHMLVAHSASEFKLLNETSNNDIFLTICFRFDI